jgi:hypothetical protein
MARVKFDGREIDQNFQIEQGVKDTLRGYLTAVMSASVIECCYDLLDGNMNPIKGKFEDKCRGIAEAAGADFTVEGENVKFRKTRAT